MKKRYFFYGAFFILLLSIYTITFAAGCSWEGSVGGALDGCLSGSDLVNSGGDMRLETGVKYQIITWTTALAKLFGLLAVGAIVYGGLMMTLAGGEDEKIKKGKDIVKWSLLGFLAIVTTGALIRIIVEVLFDIAS